MKIAQTFTDFPNTFDEMRNGHGKKAIRCLDDSHRVKKVAGAIAEMILP
jgi:hypothetical protein